MENINYENEIWRDIPEYEGFYQASNMGRIKSLERFRKGENDCLVSLKERILKLYIDSSGYYRVILCKQSIQKKYYIHRLVWSAFNGPIPENMQVNHINEIKTDNRLENLNLMTPKENRNWGTGIERQAKKCSKPVLQFTLDDILVKEYPSIMQAERETGFANQYISVCCKGKYKTAYNFKWRYKE